MTRVEVQAIYKEINHLAITSSDAHYFAFMNDLKEQIEMPPFMQLPAVTTAANLQRLDNPQ